MSQITYRNSEIYANVESLTESEYHRLLAVERRRTTLAALAELSTPIDLDELAVTVVKREMDMAAPDETTTDQIAGELHHIHLPMMDDLDVIDYNQDNNRVRLGP